MTKTQDRNHYRHLSRLLAENYARQRFSLPRRAITELLHKHNWAEILLQIDNDGEFSSDRLVEAIRPSLDELGAEPAEGWPAFAYRYAVSLSFPQRSLDEGDLVYEDGAVFFLAVMQIWLDQARLRETLPQRLNFLTLTPEELEADEFAEEYLRAKEYFRSCFVYEMMLLGLSVTPYKTLEHIVGVQELALSIGRQAAVAGVPLDLALLSGAASLHDIGKFGCRKNERVPYLHYYYTDYWCRSCRALTIGHLAANHSAWDLELENLSAESLLLVYADFRVKQIRDEQGVEQTRYFSLDDAFDVILNKLDDVDGNKRRRYLFVYTKLHDFEDYLRSLGVDVDRDGRAEAAPIVDVALMQPGQEITAYKHLGIKHNLALMHSFNAERMFANILEAARSEKNWQDLRAYLAIFEEYFTYLSAGQKVQTMDFLYELLMHREGDIRRSAAALIGNIIAHFEDGYRKEMPEGYENGNNELTSLNMWKKHLRNILAPDHKLTDQHKSWISYSLKIVADSLLQHCPPSRRRDYMLEILTWIDQPAAVEDATAFTLLDMLHYLPLELFTDEELGLLLDFGASCASSSGLTLRTAALRLLRSLAELPHAASLPCFPALRRCGEELETGDNPALIFLLGRLRRATGLDDGPQQAIIEQRDIISDIFLDNLKMATPWIIKSVNIKLLLDQVDRGRHQQLLHIASHFSNLIKNSERVVVRHDAGAALVRMAPLLELDQRNEIATELAKGLEVGEYEFSKYIPDYLGSFALWLHPRELDELINHFQQMIASSSDSITAVCLDTVGALLENYADYAGRFDESSQASQEREQRLLGLLLKGLASFRPAMRQEAMLVLGKRLFASDRLHRTDKRRIFICLGKKLLSLMMEDMDGSLAFFYRAAALNHIYRFIISETLDHGEMIFSSLEKLAFFPGSFDPFTLSHKGIVNAIHDLGFEVLLSIDEFSWSKNMQPRHMRRRIALMSLADQFDVYILPDSQPVNLSNPDDLRRLHQLFPGRELYVVVGSDVVENASSYRQEPAPWSIHHCNHIIFNRSNLDLPPDCVPAKLDCIDGQVLRLTLPIELEDISSSNIRDNIDSNRDISNLIDPLAQDYIYTHGLYLREPQYKPILRARDIQVQYHEQADPDWAEQLLLPLVGREALAHWQQLLERGDHLLLLRNAGREDRVEGCLTFREVTSAQLLAELGDDNLADLVRRQAPGRLLMISGLVAVEGGGVAEPRQLLLTEVLSLGLRRECSYAAFYSAQHGADPHLTGLLQRQGFVNIEHTGHGHSLFMTDMRSPMALFQNLDTTIKEPLASDPQVLDAIKKAHHRLQTSLSQLFPGHLLLSVSAAVIHHRLIDKITELNGVPAYPLTPRRLGPYMCVPFGKILRGKVVPNTVTKTLHTDKVYTPDIRSSRIAAYPNYSSLEHQIRTIKSFMRPVILVDDLLHTEGRLTTLDPMFRAQEIPITKVLVGLMSGRGRDKATLLGRDADSIYYVPNLRAWFVESSLYPFIGGDTIRRGNPHTAGLLSSVNLILPYATAPIFNQCEPADAFQLSLTCLTNTRDILRTLESRYRQLFQRNLTLSRLSEAIILPLCPDRGSYISYEPNLPASLYVENDIELLLRTGSLMS